MKNNLGTDKTGLAYSIKASESDRNPSVAWESTEVTVSAEDVLGLGQNGEGDAVS